MFAPPAHDLEIVLASEPKHVVQARELFLEYAGTLGFSLCFQGFDDELRNLPGAYAPPAGRLLIAFCAGDPAGCVALRDLGGGVCEMKRLYVRPVCRGKRAGGALVDRLIQEARSIGYTRMRLDTITSSMQDAISLYRRRGFQEIPAYRENPISGALYLELEL